MADTVECQLQLCDSSKLPLVLISINSTSQLSEYIHIGDIQSINSTSQLSEYIHIGDIQSINNTL